MMERSKTEKVMLQEIYNKVTRIEYNLVGDKEAGIEGVYDKLKRHDVEFKQIANDTKLLATEYKTDKTRVLAGAAVISSFFVFAWEAFKKLW